LLDFFFRQAMILKSIFQIVKQSLFLIFLEISELKIWLVFGKID